MERLAIDLTRAEVRAKRAANLGLKAPAAPLDFGLRGKTVAGVETERVELRTKALPAANAHDVRPKPLDVEDLPGDATGLKGSTLDGDFR